MEAYRLKSIEWSTIDMEKLYFNPGCAMTTHNPLSEVKMYALLKKHFKTLKMHNRCCKHTPNIEEGATLINSCAGCDRRFRSLYEGIQTLSIWEVLASLENFELPSYEGVKMSVQDSCSYRPKPQVHAAVRSLLSKMKIEVIEAKAHGSSSICCGDNFYPTLSIDDVGVFQKNRAQEMPCDDVVVYCVSCIKSMTIGGKVAHHLLDLVLDQATDIGETRLDVYHEVVQAYSDKSIDYK